jgi:MFS superfamily sulfate permease-like transporter
MDNLPLLWLPLVGLLAVPFAIAFSVVLEPIAVLAILNTVLIVLAVRAMFGSTDLKRIHSRKT